ncbi:MAG: type III pantothenate kinase, partial [Pseudomonadota bacterium]|nr:type III pantothenate kinase [Pseudomonadota bacterium]
MYPALLVDHGNSRLKWCLDDGSLRHHGALSLRGDSAVLTVALNAAWRELPVVESVWLVSVGAPAQRLVIEEQACNLWGLTPTAIRVAAEAAGVSCGYRDPARLGVDRWAAVVGAVARAGGKSCGVIDCGSAVTVDAVGVGGRHLGGVIFPGYEAMRAAFIASTAAGPTLANDGDFKLSPFARDSEAAVAAGAWMAMLGGIERCVTQMSRSIGEDARWFLCGGDASAL